MISTDESYSFYFSATFKGAGFFLIGGLTACSDAYRGICVWHSGRGLGAAFLLVGPRKENAHDPELYFSCFLVGLDH